MAVSTDQQLLSAGVDPAAVATLAADRPAFQANQLAAELDKLGDPVVSLEDADVAVAAPSAPQELNAQLESSGDQEVDPLDVFPDEALISDRSFSPKEEYIRRGGAAAFDAKSAARLGKIRKGQEANRTVLGTAAAQVKEIIPQVGRVIKGVGQGIASGLNVFTAPAVAAVTSNETGVEFSNLVEQQAAESLHGVVAETAGLAKGIGSLGKYVSRKTGLSKDWSDMTDEEAFRAIIDEGEKEREVRSMSQGNIPALEPTRARLAEEGFPVRPEKVQEATEMGTLGWLAFGTALKLGGAGVSKAVSGAGKLVPASVLSAAQKVEQLAALRVAKDAALAAQKAGPKNAATEAALRTAQESFQAAEKAVSESNLAGAIDFANRARSAISSASETLGQGIVGRPIQLVGAAVEGLVKLTDKTTRSLGALGKAASFFHNPIGTLFALAGKEVAAPLIQKAGAAAKGYGKAVAEGQARRTLDVLGAAKDVATTSLSQYPMDYAFSIGLSDTDQEARVSAPISTALGVFPGARRGISRIVTGELITPKGTPAFKPSPAYGENKVLDATHATAMKTVDAKSAAQINWVRELARKMGGRVYLMPDTATFESALGEVWKQQNPGAEVTPAIAAQIKQAADQQGMAFGEFIAADGELQPTVFIKNPDAATHEMGHILEKVLPEQVNSRLDEQILNRLSPENIEAAGTEYVRRLGEAGAPWREVLQRLNPELSPEQYLARELRAENLGVALQNRGEAFATSPGLYRWLAQTVAKIGDVQGIPLAQSEALGFPVFGDVMRASEKAAEKILGDEAGQELIQARDARLKAAPVRRAATEIIPTSTEVAKTAEGAKGEALADELAVRDPAQADVLRKISNAVSTGQALKIDYRSAPGEPAGSPNISREARRTIIEAFRDMPESARPLWEKTSVPFRVEPTKNKGIQILTWSPEVFAANAHKMAKFISDAKLQRLSPYEVDATTKSFTPEGWQKLYEDVQTFTKNQQAGGTGSGKPLVLPERAAEMQVSVPALNEAALVPLPQATADFINILFHLPPPITTRVSRKGGTPGNIVAQEIALANEPVIGPRVVEPGKPRSAEEFKGFPGRTIKEVNPLRAEMERAVETKSSSNLFKTSFPSLIEVNQRLNLEHIADATLVPEVAAIRPVTDILRAGFLPGAERSVRIVGEEILRMTPDEFSTATRGYVGGLTSEARKIGLGLKSPEELSTLRQFVTQAQAASKVAMAQKDFDTAMSEVSKVQMFNEAIQSATGTGSNGEALRAALGADYKPPFPEGGAEAAQFLPKVSLKENDVGTFAEDTKFGNFWLSPDGKFYQAGDHGQWAKERLIYSEGEKPATKSYEAEEAFKQKGWVRISMERETTNPAVFLNGNRLNPKQESAIDLWSAENPDVEIVDTRQLRRNISDASQFLPKKTKDEFKLLPAGVAGSKAWVLPGGKIEQLGAQWHHDWLDQNKAVQEKYGLEVPPFEGGDAEGVREQALKKGFARVNYSRNTGTLTVEARVKDWRKQKGAVERLIEENLDEIDNVTVHLMDESVQKVVDSASERLFNYDSDVEKLANLPFITKGEVRGGGQFLPSENKVFTDELEKIRSGKTGGQTFNADGSVWQTPETPSDIVTLASVNIPREKLTAAEFEKATAPYQELLAQPNVAAGVFAFEQGGKPSASIDINAVVPQSFRDNTLAFAKANDQVAIWDAAKNQTVEAGGAGNTKITSPDQMRAAAESLAAGEPFQFLPAEQSGLPGITTGREFDRKAIEGMSQAQLKEYFPEAVIPKKNSEYIPAEIANSPLAKAAGSKEAAVQAFADKLVQFYRQREDTPGLQAGAKWYSEFTPLLKKEFGKDSRIFAELLAATSPNNTPKINFAFALDAFQNWKAGKYDKMITKFNEGLNKLADGGLEKVYQRDLKAGKVEKPPEKPSEATYLAHWIDKNNLIPRGSSGARFSMHSVPVLKVLARKWLELNTGLKTDNFIKNLVGEGDEATVDVWADRTMRRLGYEGFKDRWRILPRNKTGVTDEDFVFSQQAFRKAAEEIGIKPSALQGALWFAEKQYWNEQGWARLDLGDYKSELERMPQLRAGFRSREAAAKAEAKAGQTEQLEILPRQLQPKEGMQPRGGIRGVSHLGGLGGSYAAVAADADEKELEILPK